MCIGTWYTSTQHRTRVRNVQEVLHLDHQLGPRTSLVGRNRRGSRCSLGLGGGSHSEQALLQQAQEQGLTLRKADNKSGYANVSVKHGRGGRQRSTKPFEARVTRGSKLVHLGGFATAEEAALCIARYAAGLSQQLWFVVNIR